MPEHHEISPRQLLALLGMPDAPVIVDICTPEDFADDPHLIPGAIRHNHADPHGLCRRLARCRAVIVCQKGLKLSQGMAAWLRSEGIAARALGGGMRAWRALPGAPCLPFAALPRRVDGSTVWAAPFAPDAETLACAWLLRRFVDPGARVLFVPAAEVADVCERFGAASLGGGFSALCQRLGLDMPTLARMSAQFRNGNAGDMLRALHALHRDDTARIAAAITICDALHQTLRAPAPEPTA